MAIHYFSNPRLTPLEVLIFTDSLYGQHREEGNVGGCMMVQRRDSTERRDVGGCIMVEQHCMA